MKMNFQRGLMTLLLFTVGMGAVPVFAHGDGRVDLEWRSARRLQAGPARISFELFDEKAFVQLGDTDLMVTHEKKLHMFVFDLALTEFHHLHPEFADGKWSVEWNLPVNGHYKVWVQGQLASDEAEFTSLYDLEVIGGSQAHPSTPTLVETRSGEDRGSLVSLSDERIKADRIAMPLIRFARTDGSTPDVTPYLGALAHVVAVPADGDSLIHVHPMLHNGELMLHTVFPKAGLYRVWAQFIERGELRVVPLVVEVVDP